MTYKVYGEKQKGKQPPESAEMVTFFNELRARYPEIARLATHIKNEGKRTMAQAQRDKAEGLVTGFPDVVIVGAPAFVCEMKSKSKTSRVSPEQKEILNAMSERGVFACVAYGWEAAMQAVEDWLDAQRR